MNMHADSSSTVPLLQQGCPESPEELDLSVVMPCLNEAETLAACIQQAQNTLRQNGIRGEIIVADNGSTDGSQEIANRLGARVVHVDKKGYGSALMGGIAAARGKYVVMGDADCSYDFGHIPRFLARLREGYELVMGNRFQGGIQPGAMPPLHRYLGNPVLSRIGRVFFHCPCGDFHCGLRGFNRQAIIDLNLLTTGMEFASEMVVSATLHGLRMSEIPTTLSPDGRSRQPHLRSWRDGWRHLRFLLIYSPRWLFLYPGLALMTMGAILMLWLLFGSRVVGGVVFDIHTMLFGAAMVLIGFQSVLFSVLSKVFAMTTGLVPWKPGLERLFRIITLETGLLTGVVLTLGGIAGSVFALRYWESAAFGPLDPSKTMRIIIPAVLAVVLGCQIIMSSFFFSMLGLKRRR
jgi:glycosyltransferase involved in cell wall biosynthesis